MGKDRTLEIIKTEIERRKMESIGFRNNEKREDWASFFNGEATALENLLSFLSTLESEKPMNPDDAMKELDEKIALVKQRGTWDGVDVDKYMDEVRGREPEKPINQEDELNGEIKKFVAEYGYERSEDILLIAIVARHFAEWGAEHFRDITKMISGSSEIPKDLEEAADNHIRKVADAAGHPGWDWETQDIADAFKAGAEWQAEQLLKSSPLPEDTVLFNKGVEEGKRLMMEEFPKWKKIKAGERLPCPAYVWTIAYDNYPDCFEGRLMPNIEGVKVGRDTWYLPVDVIHNLPKEDEK